MCDSTESKKDSGFDKNKISRNEYQIETEKGLTELPGFITVTTSLEDVDMIYQVADETEKRARMPCGHIIAPSTMTDYCRDLLSKGKFKFECPSFDSQTGKFYCGSQWEYFLVRHVACLNEKENQEFEKKISENYLRSTYGLQHCPSCKVLCSKTSEMGNHVRCSICKKAFCWSCLRDWIASEDSNICANPVCDRKENRVKILANCPTKELRACKACPSIRACPKCFLLIEQTWNCGSTICPNCNHGFCFICLKGRKSNRDWPCSFAGNCPVAPRQILDKEQ